jgi:hypothetical protein
MSPAVLAVIEMGTVGISIYDIDSVVYLTVPKNPGEVVASQVQTMGRGNRFPFKGMRGHDQMREQINSLNISLQQKYMLAQYVVHKCETHIFAVRNTLMDIAYTEYAMDTMPADEGLQYYMGFMSPASPAYVKQVAKPRMSLSYDASALNRLYKRHYCEACTAAGSIDTATQKSLCEVNARKVREFERGEKFTDDEWADTWFHTLVLDHNSGNRNDYSLQNLVTRCPTNNGVKTYDAKDFLGKYDANGNKDVPL